MQPQAPASIKPVSSPDTATLKKYLVHVLAYGFIGAMYLLLPALPLLASIAYQRWKYVLHYWTTLKKMVIHLQALSEGPVHHYLHDVTGKQPEVPAHIQGSCTQCGSCCLDKRCVFLEQVGDDKYQCGIYHAPLRRYSNCGSFPLNAHDIARYDCPGYTVVQEAPIHWMPQAASS